MRCLARLSAACVFLYYTISMYNSFAEVIVVIEATEMQAQSNTTHAWKLRCSNLGHVISHQLFHLYTFALSLSQGRGYIRTYIRTSYIHTEDTRYISHTSMQMYTFCPPLPPAKPSHASCRYRNPVITIPSYLYRGRSSTLPKPKSSTLSPASLGGFSANPPLPAQISRGS